MGRVEQRSIRRALAAVHDAHDRMRADLLKRVILVDPSKPGVVFNVSRDAIADVGIFTSARDQSTQSVVRVLRQNSDRVTQDIFPAESPDEIQQIIQGKNVTDAMRQLWQDSLKNIRNQENKALRKALDKLYNNERSRIENMGLNAAAEKSRLERELRDIPRFRLWVHIKASFNRTAVPEKPDPDELRRRIQEIDARIEGASWGEESAFLEDLENAHRSETQKLENEILCQRGESRLQDEVAQMEIAYRMVGHAAHSGETINVETSELNNRWRHIVDPDYDRNRSHNAEIIPLDPEP